MSRVARAKNGHEPKICERCGLPFEWRKKWERDWASVKYCSEKCKSGKAAGNPLANAAGGAYINRMTQYCKGCAYDPKLRVGNNACPFTTLYWDFLDRNREAFAKNHRMGQQLMGLNRLSDLPELRERATEVLAGLEQGLV